MLLTLIDPENDVLLVRLPIVQACNGSYPNVCDPATGADPLNDLVTAASVALDAELLHRFPLSVGRLPMEWTRATDGVGRHPCAFSDYGGSHFGGTDARTAFIQQILHAVSLVSADKPKWRETWWFQHVIGRET